MGGRGFWGHGRDTAGNAPALAPEEQEILPFTKINKCSLMDPLQPPPQTAFLLVNHY